MMVGGVAEGEVILRSRAPLPRRPRGFQPAEPAARLLRREDRVGQGLSPVAEGSASICTEEESRVCLALEGQGEQGMHVGVWTAPARRRCYGELRTESVWALAWYVQYGASARRSLDSALSRTTQPHPFCRRLAIQRQPVMVKESMNLSRRTLGPGGEDLL